LPSRVKGKIRVKLPFVPDWMGDQFVDPLGLALPFDAFLMPWEQAQKAQSTTDGRADRLLEEMYQNGELTDQEYQEGQTHQGPVWDQVVSQALQNDEELKFDAFDFASLISSPHAPILWAWKAAHGQQEDIGPFMPFSRTVRNVATTLGIEDWSNSPLNMEAKLRRSLGLPAYDKWDDYRTDRMLSNLLATGDFTQKEIKDAMFLSSQVQAGQITSDQAKEQSEAYREAVKKMNIEFSGGGVVGTLLKAVGIPIQSYPEGEQMQRALQDDFGRALEAYNLAKESDGKRGDLMAYQKFFDAHPEYEARLALYDEPDERMRKFMVDNLWSQYNSLPTLTKREIREQLPDDFAEKFLSSETRAYDSISVDEMQVWLKLMGGETPGILSAESRLVYSLFGDLELTDPETANRGQVFYDIRSQYFPDWYDQQQEYYSLPEGAPRRKYKKENPDYADYSNWRVNWMMKNPDLVPYLTDSEWLIEKAKKKNRRPETGVNVPVPTAQELAQQTSRSMQELLVDYVNGEPMPAVGEQELERLGELYGLTPDQVLGIMAGAR